MADSTRSLALLRGGGVIAGLFLTTSALLAGALVNFFLNGPARGSLLILAIALVAVIVALAWAVLRERIDCRLERRLGKPVRGLSLAARDFPDYRFVDVFRAVERTIGSSALVLDSSHMEDLGSIVNGALYGGYQAEPARTARSIDPTNQAYFPLERFWIRPSTDGGLIARLKLVENMGTLRVEIASADTALAEQTLSAIADSSVATSIYRGHTVEVSFTPGVKDAFGNIDQAGKIKVDFRRTPPVAPEDIVLDPAVWPLIEHSLIALHLNREALATSRVALKRGLLFYGPPGTGKSYTCRHIASLLADVTVVYSTGMALQQVSSTFNLARLLKPALIVMEDVDLVFASRDVNAHGAALGDLFDQMDLVRDEEPINVILTTNAIDRLEAAIKDRPGRVSQCLYFGPPSAELRRRYFESLLQGHDASSLDLIRIVSETDGATQAFLKELVHRALQSAVEQKRVTNTGAGPTTADFLAALAEIRAFDGKATRAITGFRVADMARE